MIGLKRVIEEGKDCRCWIVVVKKLNIGRASRSGMKKNVGWPKLHVRQEFGHETKPCTVQQSPRGLSHWEYLHNPRCE